MALASGVSRSVAGRRLGPRLGRMMPGGAEPSPFLTVQQAHVITKARRLDAGGASMVKEAGGNGGAAKVANLLKSDEPDALFSGLAVLAEDESPASRTLRMISSGSNGAVLIELPPELRSILRLWKRGRELSIHALRASLMLHLPPPFDAQARDQAA